MTATESTTEVTVTAAPTAIAATTSGISEVPATKIIILIYSRTFSVQYLKNIYIF